MLVGETGQHGTDRNVPLLIGAGLSAVWLLLIVLFWFFAPDNPEGTSLITRLAAFLGAVLPFALIWMAVFLASTVQSLQNEAEELRARLRLQQDHSGVRPAFEGVVDRPQPAPARPAQSKPAATKAAAPQQTTMRFEAPETVDISPETLIRALNFPDDADDHAAIAAMRTALQDHELARAIRAAQDVVTLLAGHEITMDGIPPDNASAAVWRRFAKGERGAAIATIGSTQSELALEIVTTLLHGDEIFRDSAHHFLRHFDQTITRNASRLDDAELEALVDTRSARAFILLGRASGSFGR